MNYRSITRCFILSLGILLVFIVLPAAVSAAVVDNTGGCVSEVSGFSVQCTANDVQLTTIQPLNILDDGCKNTTGDTVTFNGVAFVSLTAENRYDIGLYFARDGDPNGDGAESGECAVTMLDNFVTIPYDAVNLDNDACGDINDVYKVPNAPLHQFIGPITVKCVDENNDGLLDIMHCETWKQPGKNEVCTSPIPGTGSSGVGAGAPSKCNCGVFQSVCIAIDDGNPCTDDICDPNTGLPSHPPKIDGTLCGDPADTVCDNPDTCNGAGVCQPNYESTSVVCRASAGVCDLEESCTGSSADCPADGNNLTTECRASAGVCDLAEFCSNASDACPPDGANLTTECRASAGVCDLAEFCSNASDACPPDVFEVNTVSCNTELCQFCTGQSADCPTVNLCPTVAICRTPGFWKERGCGSTGLPLSGPCEEKTGSQNITQQVIKACGGCLDVCGMDITNTALMSYDSAIEAMCDNPGKPIFHLTAMALNCCISGFGPHCSGGGDDLSNLFTACNNDCIAGNNNSANCKEVDCWNNGGEWDNGMCQYYRCDGTGSYCNPATATCTCIVISNNCHSMDLCNEDLDLCFDEGKPAGSSKACKDAKKNACNVFDGGCTNGFIGGSCD